MAEVKVKITAQNQTQTGFQSVLADAEKTASQVKRSFADVAQPTIRPAQTGQAKPMGDFSKELADLANASNDGTKAAAEEMLAELRRAREEAKTTANEIENIPAQGGGLIGRLFGAAGLGAGIGLAVKQQIEQVAQEYNKLIDLNSALDASFQAISSATTFDEIISGAKRTQEQIANIARETENFKSGIFNTLANFAYGGHIFDNLDQLKEDAAKLNAQNIIASLKQQNVNLGQQISAAKEGRLPQELKRQDTERQRAELESIFRLGGFSSDQVKMGLQAFDRNRNLQQEKQFAEEDFAAKQKLEERQRREEEKRARQLSAGTRLGNVVGKDFGPGNIEGIRSFEREQMRQAEEAARAMLGQQTAGQPAFQGGMTASSLQRIGFASSEFRDTRTKEDPTKAIPKIADLVKEIVTQLKSGEPLVLAGTK